MIFSWMTRIWITLFGCIVLCIWMVILTGILEERSLYRHVLHFVIIAGYIFANLYVTVLNRTPIESRDTLLVPFLSYFKVFIRDNKQVAFNEYYFAQVALNWLIYVPMGYILPFVWPRVFMECRVFLGIVRAAIVSSIVSITIESIQYYYKLGYFEIDDIINNTLGCIVGYIFYIHIYKYWRKS